MKTCCFIIPYFGKFPEYFPLFLKSCQWNRSFNWIIFTDSTEEYHYPENVKKVYMTFKNLQAYVQSRFNFEISLSTPYKLCDYKPAYGYIFEEYLRDYAYWGHCDLDTIMGNLSIFLSLDFLKRFDKLFCLGHMTIYKNTHENNRVFMSEYEGKQLYKIIFSTNNICWFDEEWKDNNNINEIFSKKNKRIFRQDLSLNIYFPKTKFFRTVFVGRNAGNNGHGYKIEKYKDAVYLWKEGNLCRYIISEDKLIREDFPYIHLQKRRMKISRSLDVEGCNVFKIIPNEFRPLEVSDVTLENFAGIKRSTICFHYLNVVILPKFLRQVKKIKCKIGCHRK